MSVGIMGYLTFGDSVSSQFTLNMPKELYASEIATWTTVREETSLLFLCYYKFENNRWLETYVQHKKLLIPFCL